MRDFLDSTSRLCNKNFVLLCSVYLIVFSNFSVLFLQYLQYHYSNMAFWLCGGILGNILIYECL